MIYLNLEHKLKFSGINSEVGKLTATLNLFVTTPLESKEQQTSQ